MKQILGDTEEQGRGLEECEGKRGDKRNGDTGSKYFPIWAPLDPQTETRKGTRGKEREQMGRGGAI